MKFSTAILAAATACGVLAAPIDADGGVTNLEDRGAIVTCRPKLNGKEKAFKVDVAAADAIAREVLFTTGKSGDPHRFFNGDDIKWGVNNCDKKDAILFEYPIFDTNKKAVWQKDTKTDKQPGGATPIRVVYSNSNGGVQLCGIMTHSEVNAKNQGLKFFERCT